MAHTIQLFFSVLATLLLLAIFIPIFNTSIGETSGSDYVTGFEATVAGSSYLSILLNIVLLPLWTFGLNYWLNIIVLLPLRVVGMITFYYMINPAKS